MNNIRMKINTIVRIFLFTISYFIIVLIFQYIGGIIAKVDFTNLEHQKTLNQDLIISVFDLSGTFLVIWLFMKFVEKQHFIKLGFYTKNKLIEFIFGIILGLIIMVTGYLLLIYLKEVIFIKVNFDFKELLKSIVLFSIVAVVEET